MNLQEIKSLVSYDPETGAFRWAVKGRPACRFGEECGTYDKKGYRVLSLNRKKLFAHRVAWLFVHGEWPSVEIDHINCVRDDNRISNLRLASREQNCANTLTPKNNTSGVKGVAFDRSRGKWMAHIHKGGKFKNLGRFESLEQAQVAYANAANEMFGQFARLK